MSKFWAGCKFTLRNNCELPRISCAEFHCDLGADSKSVETALANVSDVVGDLADFAAGSPKVTKLPVSRHRQTRLMALSVFIFRYGNFSRAPYLSMIVVVAACRPVYPP
jgi:hypothetical protein